MVNTNMASNNNVKNKSQMQTGAQNKQLSNMNNLNNFKKSINNNNINKLAPNATNNTAKNVINDNSKPVKAGISEKLEEAREKAKAFDIIADNYFLLLGLTIAIIILILVYFFSSSFRVERCIERMAIFQSYQSVMSLNYNSVGDTLLGDYYVSSAYNPCHCGYQMLDYTSEKTLVACLQSGARYLELNVFNSEYGPKAFPVVSMGYKTGEWKMMATDTPLETCFQVIASNAFKIRQGSEGVPNPDDPLFIGLNLNTNSNLSCLNLIAALITKYFPDRLLDSAYSFQNSNAIGSIKMEKLIGKVVFFSSDGFQGSGLEEVVNYCWDNYDNNPDHAMKHLYYKDLTSTTFNKLSLIEFNRNGLTIVVPHVEGDILNNNFNPTTAFELGCQFVAMEFQYIDPNMDLYITKFKEKSFIMKDDSLQHDGSIATRTTSKSKGPTAITERSTQPQTTQPQTTQSNSEPTVTDNSYQYTVTLPDGRIARSMS
jgi:hypothetical protein